VAVRATGAADASGRRGCQVDSELTRVGDVIEVRVFAGYQAIAQREDIHTVAGKAGAPDSAGDDVLRDDVVIAEAQGLRFER
jgi:hypothetical protein